MQDTDETSMRVLLARGAAGAEPPLGSLINDVVRAGLTARRRRRVLTAGSALGAAVVLAAGTTSAIGHSPSSARASRPAAGSATVTWTQTRVKGTVPSWFRFAAPQAPHPGWTGPRARTTAKSGTQLLLDDVAGGTEVSHLQATLKNLGNELGAQAAIRGSAGNGSAVMQMSRRGQQPGGCDSAGSIVCRTYSLPGGTKIEEDLAVAWPRPGPPRLLSLGRHPAAARRRERGVYRHELLRHRARAAAPLGCSAGPDGGARRSGTGSALGLDHEPRLRRAGGALAARRRLRALLGLSYAGGSGDHASVHGRRERSGLPGGGGRRAGRRLAGRRAVSRRAGARPGLARRPAPSGRGRTA